MPRRKALSVVRSHSGTVSSTAGLPSHGLHILVFAATSIARRQVFLHGHEIRVRLDLVGRGHYVL